MVSFFQTQAKQENYIFETIQNGIIKFGEPSSISRRNDWHKMEYNFTNYGVGQVFMDDRLIYENENFDGFDTLIIKRENRDGHAANLTMDKVMICDANHIKSISLPQDEVTLGYYDTYDININNYKATFEDESYPTTDKISYSSSNNKVARMTDQGTVEHSSVGEAVATLETSNGLKASTKIICKDIKVESVKISNSPLIIEPNYVDEITLLPNTKQVLNAIIAPQGTTNRKVNWKSSDESIVSVVDGLVSAGQKLGTATITATTDDGAKTAECKVVVSNDNHEYGLKLFVSTDGSDKNGNGTSETPFASFAKVKDYISEIKSAQGLPKGGIVVYFKEGNYQLSEGINFDETDSGTKDSPIVYKAFENDEVNFTGSINIAAKDMSLVTDEETIAKLPQSAKGKVYEFDLSNEISEAISLPYVGHATGNLTWLNSQGKNTKSPYYSVLFDGKNQTLARWPNAGETVNGYEHTSFLPITKNNDKGAYPRGWQDDIKGRDSWVAPEDRDMRDLFNIESSPLTERMKSWVGVPFDTVLCDDGKITDKQTDIWIMGYFGADFSDQSIPLHEIKSNGQIIGDEPSGYSVQDEDWARFYVYNLIQELDVEGEWYLDQSTFKLYLFPPKDADMTSDTLVQIPTLNDIMFTFDGASHISFHRLNMGATLNSAVKIINSSYVEISNAVINGTQKKAGEVGGTSTHSGFSYCEVFDVNGGFSVSGGSKKTLEKGLNYIKGCTFDNFATLSKSYNPAVSITGVGNIASFNEIKNGPHCGVLYYGNEHLLEFLDIHDVVLESADQAAIYTGANVSDRGTIIRNNFIHDVAASKSARNSGIYLDGNTGGIFIIDNVFDNMTIGVYNNGCRDTIMIGNTFVNCDEAISISDCAYMEIQAWYKHGYGLFSNTFSNSEMPYDLTDPNTPYAKYPHLIYQANDYMMMPKYNKVIDNTVDSFGLMVTTLSRTALENAHKTIVEANFIKNNVSSSTKRFDVDVTSTIGGTAQVSDSSDLASGSIVVATAKADDSFNFDGWYIGEKLVSTQNMYYFEVDSNVKLQAVFSK